MNQDDAMRAGKLMGEIEHLMHLSVFNYAMMASAARRLRRSGRKQAGLDALGGNEIKVTVLIKMLEELERHLHGGMELADALQTIVTAGWINRIESINDVERNQS